jgi:hypothetical protein
MLHFHVMIHELWCNPISFAVYTSTLANCVKHRFALLGLLVTANAVPSSSILVTLVMEAIRSSEMSVLGRVTRRNITEDVILHSRRRKNSNLTYFVPILQVFIV